MAALGTMLPLKWRSKLKVLYYQKAKQKYLNYYYYYNKNSVLAFLNTIHAVLWIGNHSSVQFLLFNIALKKSEKEEEKEIWASLGQGDF